MVEIHTGVDCAQRDERPNQEARPHQEHEGQRHTLRLCVLRKSQVATQLAQRKAEESAREKGHQVRPETLRLAAFVLVLTSLPVSWGTALVLELYAPDGRWS